MSSSLNIFDVVLKFVLIVNCSLRTASSTKNVLLSDVVAVAGEPAYLPCNISTDEGDAVLLVLWYREDLGTPVYSVDARDRDFSVAERWSDESVFASRAYFLPERRPAELGVDRVRAADHGVYRCRVDFKVAQTRNSIVNLTVIVPPQRIVITDAKGEEKKAIIGPFVEGDTVTLRCDVYGGNPRPWVKWYRDEIEVSSRSFSEPPPRGADENAQQRTSGVLSLGPLGRADVRSQLTCRSGNNDRTTPLDSTLQIDMNFAPLTVNILGSNQPISAGRRYDLLCQSSGSRPPATLTWWKNNKRLEKTKETTSTDGNTTTSTLSFVADKTDAGQYLACRAENPAVVAEPLEDGWNLDIQYVPETVVRLGTNLNPDNIREGSDVYFDCIVRAHPYIYKVEWRHNGRPLNHNVGQGIIISNQSLVLQGVGRRTAGNYSCVGFNAEGDGESDPFPLDVLFAPTCAPNQQRVHGVAKQERAQITCLVDANPPDVQFRWTFNNTADSMDVSAGHVNRAGTSSTVSYTPLTELDYGTLLCWASNRIGRQRVPCVYHIIAAGRPDQVHNCSVLNASMTSFALRCLEGFNGGMPQSFVLEVMDSLTQELKVNVTSPVPRFAAVGLQAGRTYSASVSAFNGKGRGEPLLLQIATLRPPEKQHTVEKGLDLPRTAFRLTPTLSVVVGGAAAVLIVALVMIIALRNQCAKHNGRRRALKGTAGRASPAGGELDSPAAAADKARHSPGKEPAAFDSSESDERNPDIIPEQIDSDLQVDYFRKRQHVSTIETCSPSRGARATGGYCALRNGAPFQELAPPPVHANMPNLQSPIPPPINYATATCTLPRGGHWPSYGGTIAGVRPLHAQVAYPGIPLQHIPPRTLPRGFTNAPRITEETRQSRASSFERPTSPISNQPLARHDSPNQMSFRKMSQPSLNTDDECLNVTSETPLMSRDKRESTV